MVDPVCSVIEVLNVIPEIRAISDSTVEPVLMILPLAMVDPVRRLKFPFNEMTEVSCMESFKRVVPDCKTLPLAMTDPV